MGVQINGDTGNISATKADYSGNVTIGGTLTYEDVTNIDSVGLITARNGIEVGARPGVGASISVDGNAEFAGIVTATTFKGDGSQLSNITSTTINSNADNRVITGSGTANTLNGESSLTYSSTGDLTQTVTVDGKGIVLSAGDLKPMITGNSNRSAAGNTILGVSGKWNDTEVARIAVEAGSDTTNKDDGTLNFSTTASGGSLTKHMVINSNGYVTKPKNLCLSYTSSSSQNLTSGTLIYATEIFDVGDSNAYNTSTGVFTAPVTGVYNFYHEYYNQTGGTAMTQLMKSTNSGGSFSQIKIFGRQGDDDSYTSAGFSFLAQANADDQFKITHFDGTVHINTTYTHFQVQLVQ